MTDPRERRRFTRAHLKAQIDWEKDLNEYSGFTENISEGGVFVATPNHLPMGEPVELRVEMQDGSTVTLRARVAWIRPGTDEEMTGMGLQFVNPPEDLVNRIRNYVEAGDPQMLLWRIEE